MLNELSHLEGMMCNMLCLVTQMRQNLVCHSLPLFAFDHSVVASHLIQFALYPKNKHHRHLRAHLDYVLTRFDSLRCTPLAVVPMQLKC